MGRFIKFIFFDNYSNITDVLMLSIWYRKLRNQFLRKWKTIKESFIVISCHILNDRSYQWDSCIIIKSPSLSHFSGAEPSTWQGPDTVHITTDHLLVALKPLCVENIQNFHYKWINSQAPEEDNDKEIWKSQNLHLL